MPAEQVPLAAYVRRVVVFAHVGPGGVVHVTPWHGSPLHALPVQPNWHVESANVYVHVPPEHEPAALYVRSVVAEMHALAGGELHALSRNE